MKPPLDLKIALSEHGYNTPEFTLKGLHTLARVVSVHDGDSLKVVIPVLERFFKFNVRLNRIDTCEITSKNKTNKEAAIKARNRVVELVTCTAELPLSITQRQIEAMLEANVRLIVIHCLEMDKYGRVLAEVYTDETCAKSVSDVLMEEGLAFAYDGKKKLTEDEQEHTAMSLN